jgi:hypothetical protein
MPMSEAVTTTSLVKDIQKPCSKLRDRHIGPFFITKKVSTVAFTLKLPFGVRIHDVVHASLLEKRSSNYEHAGNAYRLPIVHDAKPFEVERLLDVAFNSNGSGRLLFKIRWATRF